MAPGLGAKMAAEALQAPTSGVSGALVQSPSVLTPTDPVVNKSDSYFDAPAQEATEPPPSLAPAATSRESSTVMAVPRQTYPSLGLSGNVISATLCIPHTVRFHRGRWELRDRPGSSALYDAFAHLSGANAAWNHTLVAWTGEIETEEPVHSTQSSYDSGYGSSSSRSSTGNSRYRFCYGPSLQQSSLPVPVNPTSRPEKPKLPPGAVQLSRSDRRQLEEEILRSAPCRTVPVWLHDSADDGQDEIIFTDQARWRRYAEQAIFPTFHYQPAPSTEPDFADYRRLNEAVAARILALYRPGDVVWVHDYHLLLLPQLLRQRRQDMLIGFFQHAVFPSSEFARCLAPRAELLTGMLGADLVGFQTPAYAEHFVSCCKRVLRRDADPAAGVEADHGGARVALGAFPLGVDAARLEARAFGPAVEDALSGLRRRYAGLRVVVGCDRPDVVSGLEFKLLAFERLLNHYPEWRGKVVLVQLSPPRPTGGAGGTPGDPDGAVAHRAAELAQRINGTHGSPAYQPVQHLTTFLAEPERLALLRRADAALFTEARAGASPAALAYILCQRGAHGPLLLSEFSGTAPGLPDALPVNPWDAAGTAAALHRALGMPAAERARRHAALHAAAAALTVPAWTDAFLARLLDGAVAARAAAAAAARATPPLDRRALAAAYARARGPRLFLFDYDGTLTPIVRDPAAAAPTPRLERAIRALAADPGNAVWIVSGRDQAFLAQHWGHVPGLGLVAEHGSFLRPPRPAATSAAVDGPVEGHGNGADHDNGSNGHSIGSNSNGHSAIASDGDGDGDAGGWVNLAAGLDMGWQAAALAAFARSAARCPGSHVERKRVAVTWHYRRADPDLGAAEAAACKQHLEAAAAANRWPVEVMPGKANLEVRPRALHKGAVAARLLRECGGGGEQGEHGKGGGGAGPEFAFCAGDDVTDEDMFAALAASGVPPAQRFTVAVGAAGRPTRASWGLSAPADVLATVALLGGLVTLAQVEAAEASGVELDF